MSEVKVPYLEIVRAYKFWRDELDNGHKSVSDFLDFIGCLRLNPFEDGFIALPQEASNVINILNSPHWYALLKAREARK